MDTILVTKIAEARRYYEKQRLLKSVMREAYLNIDISTTLSDNIVQLFESARDDPIVVRENVTNLDKVAELPEVPKSFKNLLAVKQFYEKSYETLGWMGLTSTDAGDVWEDFMGERIDRDTYTGEQEHKIVSSAMKELFAPETERDLGLDPLFFCS